MVVVKLKQLDGQGVYLASAYLYHRKEAPPLEFSYFINFAGLNNVIADCNANARHEADCDAYARHELWGSTELNERENLPVSSDFRMAPFRELIEICPADPPHKP